jgi:phosphatidylglycerophosphate synthase
MVIKSRNKETGRFDTIASSERITAHALALGRIGAAAEFANLVWEHSPYQSVGLLALSGAVMASDYADGSLARHAAKRLKSATTRVGKWIDQMTDKVFAHVAVGAIGMQELVNGPNAMHKTYGALLLLADTPVVLRDTYTTVERYYAEKRGLDIAALPSGKIKAAIGMGTIAVAASPLAKFTPTKVAVIAGMGAYAYQSVTSGLDRHRSYKAAVDQSSYMQLPTIQLQQPEFVLTEPIEQPFTD